MQRLNTTKSVHPFEPSLTFSLEFSECPLHLGGLEASMAQSVVHLVQTIDDLTPTRGVLGRLLALNKKHYITRHYKTRCCGEVRLLNTMIA